MQKNPQENHRSSRNAGIGKKRHFLQDGPLLSRGIPSRLKTSNRTVGADIIRPLAVVRVCVIIFRVRRRCPAREKNHFFRMAERNGS